MTEQISPKQALVASLQNDLDNIQAYLETLLPYEGGVLRFRQMAHLSILRDPKLLEANRKSLLLALIWCAFHVLEPGVDDGAWLVPFKVKGVLTVVPVPAFKGLIKRAVETGTIKDIQARTIHFNDIFECSFGTDPAIIHKPPKLGADRGQLIGVYAVITFHDGSKRFEVMDMTEIIKIRNASAAWKSAPESGPWNDWTDQMALKTVIKRAMKQVPAKRELRDLLSDDGRLEIGETVSALIHDAGLEPPGLPEEIEPVEKPKPEEYDTAPFMKLVADKLQIITDAESYKACHKLVMEMVKATARSQKTKTIPEQVMVKAAANFEGFWAIFVERWEKGQYLAPGRETEMPEEAQFQATEGPNVTESTGGDQVEAPLQNSKTEFDGRALNLWRSILAKGAIIPGIKNYTDITPENIASIEADVAAYEPPKKGSRKN